MMAKQVKDVILSEMASMHHNRVIVSSSLNAEPVPERWEHAFLLKSASLP
jgi:hypothetical protein